MSQKRVHENHEMSQALYEDLAVLKIRIAFAEISEVELDDYDHELSSISESDYSEAAQKRALKLIERKLNKQLRKRFIRKTLPHTIQVVAITLLLFFIGLTTAVATVRPIRLRIMDFIAQIEENYSAVSLLYSENDEISVPEKWNGNYFPLYIPIEYTLESIDSLFNSIRFSASEHRSLEFCELDQNEFASIDLRNKDTFEIKINDCVGLCRVDNNGVSLAWKNDQACFLLFYSGTLDEAEQIAESVQYIR